MRIILWICLIQYINFVPKYAKKTSSKDQVRNQSYCTIWPYYMNIQKTYLLAKWHLKENSVGSKIWHDDRTSNRQRSLELLHPVALCVCGSVWKQRLILPWLLSQWMQACYKEQANNNKHQVFPETQGRLTYIRNFHWLPHDFIYISLFFFNLAYFHVTPHPPYLHSWYSCMQDKQ